MTQTVACGTLLRDVFEVVRDTEQIEWDFTGWNVRRVRACSSHHDAVRRQPLSPSPAVSVRIARGEHATMEQLDFGGEIVWRPSPAHVENANLTKFMRAHGLGTLDELQKRSTADIAWFWNAVIRDLGNRFDTTYGWHVDLA